MPSLPRAVRSAFSFRAALAALFIGVLAVLCFFLYPLMAPEAEIWRVRVARVVDGDSLVLATGEQLRLRGIGAPDLKHREHPEQYYGMEAKKILAYSVAGRELFLDRGELGTDRHGRLITLARVEKTFYPDIHNYLDSLKQKAMTDLFSNAHGLLKEAQIIATEI